MSGAPRMLGAPDLRLVLPLWARDGERPPGRRRAGRGVALALAAILAALAVLVVAGRSTAPGGTAAAGSDRTAPPARSVPGTRAGGARPAGAPDARPAQARVVPPRHAAALFAQHSWYVAPPPKPPPPPPPEPPPPEPTAPPLPYTFVGSYAHEGAPPVYFLARGDRVVDARVGDELDGVYRFESANAGHLVFVYLPLNVRQSLQGGVSK